MFLLCARGKHPVDVAGDHVNLDIELSPLRNVAQSRLVRSVRDDVYGETRPVLGIANVVDCQ